MNTEQARSLIFVSNTSFLIHFSGDFMTMQCRQFLEETNVKVIPPYQVWSQSQQTQFSLFIFFPIHPNRKVNRNLVAFVTKPDSATRSPARRRFGMTSLPNGQRRPASLRWPSPGTTSWRKRSYRTSRAQSYKSAIQVLASPCSTLIIIPTFCWLFYAALLTSREGVW